MDSKQVAERFEVVFETLPNQRGDVHDIVAATGLSHSTVWNYLNQLSKTGQVKKIRSNKKIMWVWVDLRTPPPKKSEPAPMQEQAKELPPMEAEAVE